MNYLEKLDALNDILETLRKVNVACEELGYINDVANCATHVLRATMRSEQKKGDPESVYATEAQIAADLKFWHSQMNYWIFKFQGQQIEKQYS